jgi:hypothetical protein
MVCLAPEAPVTDTPSAVMDAVTPGATFDSQLGYLGQYADTAYMGVDDSGDVLVATKAGAVAFVAHYKTDDAGDPQSLVVTDSSGAATATYTFNADGSAVGSGNVAQVDEFVAGQNACGDNRDADCAKLAAQLWAARIGVLHSCLDPLEWLLCGAEVAHLIQLEKEWTKECAPYTGVCEYCTGQAGGHGGVGCAKNCEACAQETKVSKTCLLNVCENGWNGQWPPCGATATPTTATATAP